MILQAVLGWNRARHVANNESNVVRVLPGPRLTYRRSLLGVAPTTEDEKSDAGTRSRRSTLGAKPGAWFRDNSAPNFVTYCIHRKERETEE